MYTLMIVDDEPLTREYMKINIPKIDSRWIVSEEAMEGTEAIKILQNKKVDMIITDIKMPVMNGLTLCKIVHETLPAQKLAILSGYEEFEFAKKAIQYGVTDYILKPIDKCDLKKLLNETALQIEKEKNREITFNAMVNLSKESKKQIIKNFLKSVITNSYVEIKSLYPILFEMKENIIDSEAVIMILCIDEALILSKNISIEEIPLLRFILNETASQVFENDNLIKVFSDAEENTLLLINIEDKHSLTKKYNTIFSNISKVFFEKTGVTIYGGVGEAENEVLQLNSSYQKAYIALNTYLTDIQYKLFIYDNNEKLMEKFSKIQWVISTIKSSILDNNKLSYNTALSNYIKLMSDLTISNIFKYGIYMIKSLKSLYPFKDEYSNLAMNKLANSFNLDKTNFTTVEALSIFTKIGNTFNKNLSEIDNTKESDIISKAKEYIYAHYSEPLSLALVAEKISISPSYLSNSFHKNTGEPYTKFITKIRMEEAAKLFRTNPSIKVYDVSEKVGYISTKHFSYIFKKYFNLSPGEYKLKYNKI